MKKILRATVVFSLLAIAMLIMDRNTLRAEQEKNASAYPEQVITGTITAYDAEKNEIVIEDKVSKMRKVISVAEEQMGKFKIGYRVRVKPENDGKTAKEIKWTRRRIHPQSHRDIPHPHPIPLPQANQ